MPGMATAVVIAFACTAPILDESFELKRVASGCKFTEGPALGADGAIYFSDQPNDRILRLHGNRLSVFLSPCGVANGLMFDRYGKLVMCQSSGSGGSRGLAAYDPSTNELSPYSSDYQGKRYIAPNDLCIDRLGRIYFTDPYYKGEKSQPTSGVYLRDVDGSVKLVVASLLKPNGITITPDNQTIYISDRGTQKLHRYRVQLDGTLASDGIHYDFGDDRGIDGMCLDSQGNIYGAAGEGETTGLYVISPEGKLLLHKPMPEFSTNVTFGGEDLRDLYITASTSVYKLRTTNAGAPPIQREPHVAFAGPPTLLLENGAGEGPAWSAKTGLVFSGDGQINRWDEASNSVAVFKHKPRTNGLLFDPQGRLLRCENFDKRITRLELDGSVTLLTDSFEGMPYNQPNDITYDSRGRIYFSDPQYGPRDNMKMHDKQGKPVEGVYRIDTDGTVTRVITHEVDRPNGVLVSYDDRHLYVSDNHNNTRGAARKLYRFTIGTNVELELDSKKLIYDWGTGRGPDGMVQDSIGRLYVAGGLNQPHLPNETVDPENRAGIYVFDRDGKLIDFLAIPRDEVTNCTLGGPERNMLYITAGGSLWQVPIVEQPGCCGR